IRPEMGVEGIGVGPAEHLVLEQGVIDIVEELAEAGEQIAFGDEEVNREAHIEGALDEVELLGQAAGLLGDGVGRVANKALNGEDEEQAVDGAMGAGALEETEKLAPLRGFAGAGIVEEHGAGGVENDAAVGEPPIHVDGAAGALEFILETGREIDAG